METHLTIADRLRYIMEQQHLSQRRFAAMLRLDPSNLSKALSGKLPLTEGLINRIVVDLGISKAWLMRGEGVPYDKQPMARELAPNASAVAQTAVGTPVYDIDVTAGCLALEEVMGQQLPMGMISLPGISPRSHIVKVRGDSMAPRIANGGYIAIHPCRDMRNIFWGQIYVIELEDYRLVKYMRRHADPQLVILHSDNPEYDDMEVLRSDIRSLYVVEAILNYEIN